MLHSRFDQFSFFQHQLDIIIVILWVPLWNYDVELMLNFYSNYHSSLNLYNVVCGIFEGKNKQFLKKGEKRNALDSPWTENI